MDLAISEHELPSHRSGASEWSGGDNSPLCPTSDSYFAGPGVNKRFRRNAGPSKSVLLIHTGESHDQDASRYGRDSGDGERGVRS